MSVVTTASIIVAVVSALASFPMMLWVINFYRLRNCREIASRRPKSSLLAGVLCTFGNMIVFPTCLLYLNIKDTPFIPWVGTFLQLAVTLAINAPYHIFTFRAYMVYFDIKFNTTLADRKWRLYIDPEETNYFLKHRDSWGNQRRISILLFIHWLIFALPIVILTALNGHKATLFTRMLMGVNGADVMLANIYLYCIFPTFNDTWGIHREIKLTLEIEFVQQTLYYVLLFALNMDYHTIAFILCFTLCFIGSLLFTWILHAKVFSEFKLPSLPCVGASYASDRAHFIDMNEMHSVTNVISASDEDINYKERAKLTLHQVLENKHGFNEFARHLTKEFAIENLLFFVEILQWEKELLKRKEFAEVSASVWTDITLPHNAPISRIVHPNGDAHADVASTCAYVQAVRLFKKYIPNTAYFALNISAKQRNALYAEFVYSDSQRVTEDQNHQMVNVLKDVRKMDSHTLLHLFDDGRSEAYLLLKFAFLRFRDAEEFEKISETIINSTSAV
eukprot:92017_1